MLKGKFCCTSTFQAFVGIISTDMSLIKQVIWPNPKPRGKKLPSVHLESIAKVWVNTTSIGEQRLESKNSGHHRDKLRIFFFFNDRGPLQ